MRMAPVARTRMARLRDQPQRVEEGVVKGGQASKDPVAGKGARASGAAVGFTAARSSAQAGGPNRNGRPTGGEDVRRLKQAKKLVILADVVCAVSSPSSAPQAMSDVSSTTLVSRPDGVRPTSTPDTGPDAVPSSSSTTALSVRRASSKAQYSFIGCDPTVASQDSVQAWVSSCGTNPTVVQRRLAPIAPLVVFRECNGKAGCTPLETIKKRDRRRAGLEAAIATAARIQREQRVSCTPSKPKRFASLP